MHPSQRYICTCDPNVLIEKDDTTRFKKMIPLPMPINSTERALRVKNGLTPDVCVDACIAAPIMDLWDIGIETTGCCCGHNVMEGWVSVTPECYEKMFELGYEQRPVEIVNGSAHGLYCFYL